MTGMVARNRNILDFALSSLARRKAKNISLCSLYTLIVSAVASVMFFTGSLKHEAAIILSQAPDLVVQRLSAGRHDLMPEGWSGPIAAIRGVTAVHPRLWGYYYDTVTGANYTLVVPRAEGQPPPGSAVVGPGVARLNGLTQGDIMPLRTYRGETALFQVLRLLPSESELASADLIVIAEEDFRRLFSFSLGMWTDLAVSAGNPGELNTIAAKIVGLFPDARPILKSEILRTYDSIFDWRGGMMVVLVSVSVLAFIIFAWDKASGLSAEERREIGILKSIGWETSDVLLLKFWEGAIISLSAFICGVLLAYAHVFFFSASLFEHALKGWAVLYPRFSLRPDVSAYQLCVLFFLTVVPYAAATLIPSWRAASADPDSAMR